MAESNSTKAERELNLIWWTKGLAIGTFALAAATFLGDLIVGQEYFDKRSNERKIEEQLRAYITLRDVAAGRGYNPKEKKLEYHFS